MNSCCVVEVVSCASICLIMGQACITPDDDTRIKILQQQIKEQQKEREELERKIAAARENAEKNAREEKQRLKDQIDADPKIKEMIEKKARLFKEMMKEKNRVKYLKQEIDGYRKQMEEIEKAQKAKDSPPKETFFKPTIGAIVIPNLDYLPVVDTSPRTPNKLDPRWEDDTDAELSVSVCPLYLSLKWQFGKSHTR